MALLWSQPAENYPGGFARTYATADEALAQAVADVRAGVVPQPDRIVSEDDGTVAYDRAQIVAQAESVSPARTSP